MSKLRILQCVTSLSRSAGGLYYSVSGTSKALAKNGCDVTVVGGADAHFHKDREIWGNLKVNSYPVTGSYGYNSKAFSLVNPSEFDAIHVQGIWSMSSLLGRVLARRHIPVVVSPRGMLDPWILRRRPIIKAVHRAFVEQSFIDHAIFHALNESEKRSIAALGVPEQRIVVIPNGVDVVEKSSIPVKKEGAIYLSRLHKKKQTLELIDFWGNAEATRNVGLKIAGWGDEEYTAQVKENSSRHHNVEYVGPMYGEAKNQLFSGAKYFILPSLSEGMPMAVLEALQHGCIALITEQCNLPELFDIGAAAKIESDFSDFEEVFSELQNADPLALETQRFAIENAAKRYSWDRIAKELIDAYEAICRPSRKKMS